MSSEEARPAKRRKMLSANIVEADVLPDVRSEIIMVKVGRVQKSADSSPKISSETIDEKHSAAGQNENTQDVIKRNAPSTSTSNTEIAKTDNTQDTSDEEPQDASIDYEQAFYVHKSVLCKTATFFQNATKLEWFGPVPRPLDLTDEDPEIFQVYLQWLYTGKVGVTMIATPPTATPPTTKTNTDADPDESNSDSDLDSDMDSDTDSDSDSDMDSDMDSDTCSESHSDAGSDNNGVDFLPLIRSYVLGEKLMDTTFQDTVIQTIGFFAIEENCYPGAKFVREVYNGTTASSPLRKLLVDFYAYQGRPDWLGGLALTCQGFSFDLLVAMLGSPFRNSVKSGFP